MLISLHDVNKSYGSFRCLSQVNFSLKGGDYVCLTGRSGSGKSTFLLLLAGFVSPDSGVIQAGLQQLSRMAEVERCRWRASTVGYIFQDFRLLSLLTVEQNLKLALEIQGKPRLHWQTQVKTALERCGVSELAARWPESLSGGERQRVAIARALVGDPPLLLADEPTGNLDLGNRDRILDLLDHCHNAGATLVTVSHDPEVAARAGRLLKLENGALTDVTPVV